MKVLFDTNVVLDALLRRQPWCEDVYALWPALQSGLLRGYVGASSVTDVSYIVSKGANLQVAREAVRICLDSFQVAALDKELLEVAFLRSGRDFEDDLQIVSAAKLALDAIVTRDAEGFVDSPILILTPSQCRTHLGV
ncbi:MAG: PIN domain-containing protein [Vulcanimicrobiota bacterium]